MKTTLAITTYERPDALEAVLATVAGQIAPPDELIVADDGSSPATRDVAARFAASARFPVELIRQEHEGFRLARLRNLAVAHASGDYIVFVDGDMLLHPAFLADHRRIARRGYFTQGVRILLSAALTARLIADLAVAAPAATGAARLSREPAARLPSFATAGLGTLRRSYMLRSPALSGATRGLANHVIALKGANQGFWRDDLVAVNGFNEAFVGWGPEDKELAERLRNRGVKRQTLLFGGIAWHLDHPPATRERRALNEQILEETRARRLSRCEHGLEAHML